MEQDNKKKLTHKVQYKKMIRKIISIDLTPIEYHAKVFGFPYLPITEIISFCTADGETDIIETGVQNIPEIQNAPTDTGLGN